MLKPKTMTPVMEFMTLLPQRIGVDTPVRIAGELMRKLQVRHLPVERAGRLVGVISDRDIRGASSYPGQGELTVEDVMPQDLYLVPPDAPLGEVVSTMSERKLGSAIVVGESGTPVGIFTTTDALRVLGQMLDRQERPIRGLSRSSA